MQMQDLLTADSYKTQHHSTETLTTASPDAEDKCSTICL